MLSHSYSSDLIYTKRHSFNDNSVKLFKPLINKSQKLCQKHLSRTLNPLISRFNLSQEAIDSFTFVFSIVVIPVLTTLVVVVLSRYYHLFFISTFYYWLTLMTKSQLSCNKLYLLLWANFAAESLTNQLSVNYSSVETPDVSQELTSLVICIASIASLLYVLGFSVRMASVVTVMTQLCRLVSTTCCQSTATSALRPFLTLLFSLIGIIVALSRDSASSPVVTGGGDMRLVAWRRRRSSNTTLAVPRRTSLPALGSGNRSLSYHSNHASIASVDGAILAEAHGIVTDMLTDGQLPPHILSGLRAVASLLSPPSLSPSPRTRPAGISVALTDFNNSESDSEESPYIGERTSNIPKRGKRSMPPSLLRRMSTSTWTTTTSATGMPTLEPEPSRKRSTSFRNLAQSPVSLTAPPLPGYDRDITYPRLALMTATHPFRVSSLPMTMKARSYSTTALPIGTLASLQSRERYEKHLIFSASINENVFDRSRDQFDKDSETNTNDNISTEFKEPKKFYPRLNLTSDYDSSNDSPSGSDATLDESTAADTNRNSLLKDPSEDKAEATKEETTKDNKCILCGNTTKSIHLTEKSPLLQKKWPFYECAPPISPHLDVDGRYIVNGATYDLEELATDPLLCRINEWDYPIFELMAKTNDAILSQMTYHVFLEAGLLEAFRIPIPEFLNYFRALEKGYRNKPYHNRTHAADVLQGVYYLTSQPIPGFAQIPADSTDSPLHKTSIGPLPQSYVKHITVCEETYGIIGANYPALELMALYTAAAMHDFDHPGRTNAFLVATYSSQAILYNDRSVLENHHAAAAWGLFLSKPEFNWLRHLDRAEFKRFRFLVIEFILATDLKRHFEILAEFNAKVNDDDSTGIDWFAETDRLLVMEMSIKLADINGPLKTFDIHQQWTYRIAEEFYEQGDEEERLGLPISPFMDRKNPQLAKLQESFINHLVGPLCSAYGEAGLLPGLWEYHEATDECEQCDEPGFKVETESTIKPDQTKTKTRKVVCLQTRHLQENYDFWINILKEKRTHSMQSSPNISSDDSSTPVKTQSTLEEIIEAEETQSQGGGQSTGSSG